MKDQDLQPRLGYVVSLCLKNSNENLQITQREDIEAHDRQAERDKENHPCVHTTASRSNMLTVQDKKQWCHGSQSRSSF